MKRGRSDVLGQIRERELRGGRGPAVKRSHRQYNLIPFSSVLPHYADRGQVVVLGFSGDGENLVGYRGNELLFWHLDSPQISITAATKTVTLARPEEQTFRVPVVAQPPWLRFPLPRVFDNDEHNDDQNGPHPPVSSAPAITVLMSGSLVASFSSAQLTSRGDASSSDCRISVKLYPLESACNARRTVSPTSTAVATSTITMASFDFFVHDIGGGGGWSTSGDHRHHRHHLVDLPPPPPTPFGGRRHRHVLVLNSGDGLRFVEVETSFVLSSVGEVSMPSAVLPTSSSLIPAPSSDTEADLLTLGASSQACPSTESCRDGRSWCFPSRMQVVKSSAEWWGEVADPLDVSHDQISSSASRTRPTCAEDAVARVIRESFFDAGAFVGRLLAAQLKKPGRCLADYQLRTINPVFRPPTTNHRANAGNHCEGEGTFDEDSAFILLCIVATIERRRDYGSYPPSGAHNGSTTLNAPKRAKLASSSGGYGSMRVGTVVALDWQRGDATVLRTVRLEERSVQQQQQQQQQQAGGSQVLAVLADRFAASVHTDPAFGGGNTRKRASGTSLNNSAVLRGTPLSFIANPVFPFAIIQG